MSNLKVISFWETSRFRSHIPPYILCGIVSMKRAFGDKFLLLTPQNLADFVSYDFSLKEFLFAGIADKADNDVSKIIAKSDFIRFKYIAQNGGVWVDADTIVFDDFMLDLNPLLGTGCLVWHSEQLFGAQAGNGIVVEAVRNMENSERQTFANPGNVKQLIESQKDYVRFVAREIWDPTGNFSYSAKNWKLATETSLTFSEFAMNPNRKIMKLYNSTASRMELSNMTVGDFLSSGVLMAQAFLSIEANPNYWSNEASELEKELLPSKESQV